LFKKSYISKLCCIFKSFHELPQLKAQKIEDVKKIGKVNKLLEHLEKWLNGIQNGKIKPIKSPRATLVKEIKNI
jgi:hypothetical protein